jgi:hypothetical protein
VAYRDAVRHTLAILLLIAAVFHPVAHVDDPLVCACAHGALLDVTPPALAGVSSDPVRHTVAPQSYVPVAAATEVPARAPPAA